MRLIPRRRTVICQEFTELITDYLEGVLPGGLVRAIDRHLAGCPHCTEYLAQVRRTIDITGKLDDQSNAESRPAPPPEMLDALQAAFDDYQRVQNPEV